MSGLALDAVFSFPALWAAATRAATGKRYRPSVARYRLDLEGRLLALRDRVLAGAWRPGAGRTVRLYDPKPRVITIPPFEDRVVHQALCAVLAPRVERRAIRDNYACRVGLGTHAAMRRARAWARTWRWCVRLDVARFFPTIDHAAVRAQLAQDVPEPALFALCARILDAGGSVGGVYVPGDDLFAPHARRVGLPLGNLTSQLWANRYLDPVDHLVKDRLRLRGYLRYMDDMLLFHDDRAALEAVARRVEEACFALRLRLHPWCAQPTAAGLGFVGYRLLRGTVRVRRSSVRRVEGRLRLRRAMGESFATPTLRADVRAVFGHWGHADAWRLQERTLRRLGLLFEHGP